MNMDAERYDTPMKVGYTKKNILEDNDMKRPLSMTVPERIVLSAGYDGDDKEVQERLDPLLKSDIYDDRPIIPPDVLMVGMQTPPSTLTIDHSEATYSRNLRSQGGDGSDTNNSQFQNMAIFKKQYDDSVESDSESRTSVQMKASERMAVVGKEDDHWISYDQMSTKQLQRRIRMLENELVDTQRSNNIWKFFLLALTVINPILINFFTRKR